MTGTVQNLLAELRLSLESVYRERLRGLYLYGSYARGDQQQDSDLDVLVVLDQIDSYGAEIDRTSNIVSSVSLRYSVSISRVFVGEKTWLDGQTGFVLKVREEVIAA